MTHAHAAGTGTSAAGAGARGGNSVSQWFALPLKPEDPAQATGTRSEYSQRAQNGQAGHNGSAIKSPTPAYTPAYTPALSAERPRAPAQKPPVKPPLSVWAQSAETFAVRPSVRAVVRVSEPSIFEFGSGTLTGGRQVPDLSLLCLDV